MPVPLANQVDDIVASVVNLVHARPGRLVAVTLAGAGITEFVPRVQDRLGRAGLQGVDIRARDLPGPVRVLTLEFER